MKRIVILFIFILSCISCKKAIFNKDDFSIPKVDFNNNSTVGYGYATFYTTKNFGEEINIFINDILIGQIQGFFKNDVVKCGSIEPGLISIELISGSYNYKVFNNSNQQMASGNFLINETKCQIIKIN